MSKASQVSRGMIVKALRAAAVQLLRAGDTERSDEDVLLDFEATIDGLKVYLSGGRVRADTSQEVKAPPPAFRSAMSQAFLKMLFGRLKKLLERGYGGAVTAQIRTFTSRGVAEYRAEFKLPSSSGYGSGAFGDVLVTLTHRLGPDTWDATVTMSIGPKHREAVFHKANMTAEQFKREIVAKPATLIAELITTFNNEEAKQGIPDARWGV